MQRRRLSCLWITGDIESPENNCAHGYSSHLAAALAKSQVNVRCLHRNVTQASAIHRRLLNRELTEKWDAIILDGQDAAWALPLCMATRDRTHTLLVYFSHHSRSSCSRSDEDAMSDSTSQQLELELREHVDLVSYMAAEDAQTYASPASVKSASRHQLILTPGYTGRKQPARILTATTSRNVAVMGSFQRSATQETLRHLITVADPIFARHGICLDVIGKVPDELLRELRQQTQVTRFHDDATDASTHLSAARIALVPQAGDDSTGELLEGIFSRVPIATLIDAAATLPAALRQFMLCAANLATLIQSIVSHIDQLDKLNHLQHQAYLFAESLFDWDSRGEQLKNTLQMLSSSHTSCVAANR